MKKCPFCAEVIQDGAIKCRFCGEWIEKKPEIPAVLEGTKLGGLGEGAPPPAGKSEADGVAVPAEAPNTAGDALGDEKVASKAKAAARFKRPKTGIGGWLGLLCFGLFLGVPLVVFNNITTDYSALSPYFNAYPRLEVIHWVNSALAIAVAVYGIIAGGMLVELKKKAPEVTKTFLVALFGYSVIYGTLFFQAGLPAEVEASLRGPLTLGIIKQAIVSGVWFAYLAFSKRVRRTYIDPPEPQPTSGGLPRAEANALKKISCPQCLQYDELPANGIYEPGRYTKFEASAKRRFGFMNLTLICKSCGKRFMYEEVPGASEGP